MNALHAAMERARPYVLSILRIVAALLFLEHGLSKVLGFPAAGPPLSGLLVVAAFLETVGAALPLVGAYTRIVAFILSGEMALRLSHGPSAALVLSPGERRRRGHSLLLRLPLPRIRRGRTLESRSRRAPSAVALARD